MKVIGDQIRKHRQSKGMSISGLAHKAGVSKSYLSSIERNLQTNPSIHIIEKLALALNVNVDTLMDFHLQNERKVN
ncbi:helix-turn-helix domain-containing protein [Bacillus marinisedimentorum]|uniref:helix-turn-helix domain-containing protein n=1 Tax=Bacillus marinisedimentorum TaxID=1821260 RepID=UPI0009F3795E|nr:helix-turn-helix transcriptional regulator [Bacillus marinisedimentorum]